MKQDVKDSWQNAPYANRLTERDNLLARLKSQLLKAQQVMKSQADKK
jgi:hypothetical protein